MAQPSDFAPDLEVREAIFGHHQLRPRDLLHIRALEDQHGVEQARVCVDYVRQLREERGRKIRLVIDIRGVLGLSAEARTIYSSAVHTNNIVGAGLIVDGGISRVVGNFILALTRSDAPMRLFGTVPDAIEWLESLPDA